MFIPGRVGLSLQKNSALDCDVLYYYSASYCMYRIIRNFFEQLVHDLIILYYFK